METSKSKWIIAGFVALLVFTTILSPVSAQGSLPREDTVFVTGAQWSPASTWNLFSPSQTWGTYTTGGFMYLPLFQYIAGLDSWVPIIGESFELVNDTTLIVHLRPEAKWSDGQPITAYDVEYTYKLSLKVGTGPAAGSEPYIGDVKAIDEHTVQFTIGKEKNLPMFLLYALQFAPAPKHIIEQVYEKVGDAIVNWRNCGGACDDIVSTDSGDVKIDLPQVVSGPYELDYFDELRIVYKRIDDWWGKDIFGLPAPKYVVHRIYLSNEQALLDLRQGNVDWSGIFIPNVGNFKGIGTFYKDKPYFRPGTFVMLYFNHKEKVLQDPNLRKAIAYAIDYNEVLHKAFYDYSPQPSASLVFEVLPHYRVWLNTTLAKEYWGNELGRIPTDKEKAKQILAGAGYKDVDGDGFLEAPNGEKVELQIIVPSGWTDWMIAADLIATDLQEIGINAAAYPVDYGAYWGMINGGSYTLALGWTSSPSFYHPWDVYRYVLDPRLTPPTGNWGFYNNSEALDLLIKAANATTYEERMKYYTEIQKLLYEEMPAIPIAYSVQWYAYSEKYWHGWPNEDNPWWTEVAPYREYSLPLWVLFGLSKAGEPVKAPEWAKPKSEGGILIPNEELMKQIGGEIEVPEVTTTTETASTSLTGTEITTTTTPESGTPSKSSRFIVGLVGIIALVVVIIIGARKFSG
ncbi:ABC transporter substrate-binding protein [Thermococcus guaymasensis DSM 11113]|uniref:ABC transporter substrate-binding protein n=1 Tax=Thermococcus guaymasensis DSM 11113 TaxID=1432656 RepID=A0A0X1KJ10_9EURY|nr:ABC transporter substrate-binding protein [Thermococcus guaymasensis]AJC71237.1 ABC transporter substrate-binding protein [Thermococcus guaymasensis DSM 11113]